MGVSAMGMDLRIYSIDIGVLEEKVLVELKVEARFTRTGMACRSATYASVYHRYTDGEIEKSRKQ